MSPTHTSKVALAPDPEELNERALRAWTERMAVTPIGGGCYLVESESGNEYTVDLIDRRCTCPDYQYRGVQCKHIRRVAIEITQERVPPPGKRVADCAHCGREAFVPETEEPPLCDDCRLEEGDLVVDRETADSLVVRRVRPERADESVIETTGRTVADHEGNEGYPTDDLVVDAVYLGASLRTDDPREYAFPYSRLRKTDDAAVVE